MPSTPVTRKRAPKKCRICPGAPLKTDCEHGGKKNKPSGKQQARSVTSPKSNKGTPKRVPQARHCNQCPDRPLRSECQHTASGRNHLLNKAITTELEAAIRLPPAPQPMQNGTFSPNETPVRTPPPASTRTSVEDIEIQISLAQRTPRATSMSVIDPALHPVTPERRRSTSHMSPEPDSLHLVARDMPIARHDIFEEDANLGSSPESPSERLARHTYKRGENVLVRHMRRTSTEPYPSSSSSPASKFASSSKSVRATKRNQKHGTVQGAMRGSLSHLAVRKHALPAPIEQTSASSKRFLEMMNSILAKCEDVSIATSCWLFIGAQHIAAKAPTIHYTSPRLMEEAAQFSEENVNSFNDQMTALLRSRRSDAVVVTTELLAAEAKNRQLEKELSEAKARLKDADDVQVRYSQLLAELR